MAGSPPEDQTPPPSAPSVSGAQSAAARIGELLGTASARVERIVRDPARRPQVIAAAVGIVLVVALLAALPALTRRGTPAAPPVADAPAPPAEGQPAPAPAEQPAPSAPAGEQPAAAPPAQSSILRSYFLSALPLLLGLFWLVSAWLVDSEARRAFVVQEPWGDRRTIAYTTLAVGCVFPLILAGLIFSAWGFVTFVLDVSRRQGPAAALEAAGLVLVVCAGFLVVRGLIARWLDQRRAARRA
ncbi:MAG TPA: hypothetical protein VFN74_05345 [Chloroflexota bacterium]|nr:hypothetical protein [Chloroflexota bacterium]